MMTHSVGVTHFETATSVPSIESVRGGLHAFQELKSIYV